MNSELGLNLAEVRNTLALENPVFAQGQLKELSKVSLQDLKSLIDLMFLGDLDQSSSAQ